MTKLWILLAFVGHAAADPAVGEGTAPGQPGSAAPFLKMPPPPPQVPDSGGARKACVDAMNADPTFAESILATLGKQKDAEILKVHQDAELHVEKNERHVIYAYAAMWVIAALFVVFLWRRQRVLQFEITQLSKELDAAAKERK